MPSDPRGIQGGSPARQARERGPADLFACRVVPHGAAPAPRLCPTLARRGAVCPSGGCLVRTLVCAGGLAVSPRGESRLPDARTPVARGHRWCWATRTTTPERATGGGQSARDWGYTQPKDHRWQVDGDQAHSGRAGARAASGPAGCSSSVVTCDSSAVLARAVVGRRSGPRFRGRMAAGRQCAARASRAQGRLRIRAPPPP